MLNVDQKGIVTSGLNSQSHRYSAERYLSGVRPYENQLYKYLRDKRLELHLKYFSSNLSQV